MPKEGRFYVEYLGWKETRGIQGNEFIDPILRKLISKRESARRLHRMTIKVGKYEMQISQVKVDSHGKSQKVRYPAQLMEDVTFVSQCSRPYSDIVGCIFLGYNMQTQCAAHVHAYRFDSEETARVFTNLVSSIISHPDYKERIVAIEQDLVKLGQIVKREPLSVNHDTMGSDAGSYGSHSPNSSDSGLARSFPTADEALKQRKDIVIIKRTPSQKDKQPNQQRLFTTIQDELSHKLTLQEQKEAPILLPPKDYDTILRKHGHLSIRAKVKQRSILGADSIFTSPTLSPADSANNNTKALKSAEPESNAADQDADTGSTHSSIGDEPSVFGLYKGLNNNSVSEEMAMWSPEFSFGHQSNSSSSSGVESHSTSGLRRMKIA